MPAFGGVEVWRQSSRMRNHHPDFGPNLPRCHLDMTPSLQRCEKEKEVAGAVAFILVVIFGHRTRSRWQGQTGLFDHQDRPQVAWDPVADDPQAYLAQTNSALAVSGMHHASFSQGLSSFF